MPEPEKMMVVADSVADAIAGVQEVAEQVGLVATVIHVKNPMTGVDELHVHLDKADA